VLLVVFADPGNIAHGSRLAIGLGMRVLTEREPDLDIPGITPAQFLAGGGGARRTGARRALGGGATTERIRIDKHQFNRYL
jgi:hypothetical protein